jgi:hypothetical protein
MLGNEARLSIEMGQTGLVPHSMTLLGSIAIRYPHFGFMSGHRVVHDQGRTAEVGGMDHGIGRAEHPLVSIAAFDPRARLIASDNLGAAQNPEASARLAAKTCAVRLNMFISAPWLR